MHYILYIILKIVYIKISYNTSTNNIKIQVYNQYIRKLYDSIINNDKYDNELILQLQKIWIKLEKVAKDNETSLLNILEIEYVLIL